MEDRIEIKQPEVKDVVGQILNIGDIVLIPRGTQLFRCRVVSFTLSAVKVSYISSNISGTISVTPSSIFKLPKEFHEHETN